MSSAPGPDGLPPTLVKSWFESTLLLTFLSRVFTACFHRAYIPSQWRKSENFVLYKGVGDKANVGSFRAISLTASLAKFFERVLFKRVWSWFTRSTLFRLPQFGFRPRCSTVDAVFVLLGLIRQHTIICNTPFHVAFVDISKAFPSVDRFRLFDRYTLYMLCVVHWWRHACPFSHLSFVNSFVLFLLNSTTCYITCCSMLITL
jgi:hypothetical protein